MPYQNIAAKLTDAELLTITTALTDIANVLKDKVVNLIHVVQEVIAVFTLLALLLLLWHS